MVAVLVRLSRSPPPDLEGTSEYEYRVAEYEYEFNALSFLCGTLFSVVCPSRVSFALILDSAIWHK